MGKEKKKGKSDRDDGSSLQAAQPASNVNDTVNEDIYQSQSGEGQVDIDGAQSSDDDNGRSKGEHRQGDTVSRDANDAQRLAGKRSADKDTGSGGNDPSPEPSPSEPGDKPEKQATKKSKLDKQLMEDQQHFLGDDSQSSSSAVMARPLQLMNTMRPMSTLTGDSLKTFRANLINCDRNGVAKNLPQFFTAELSDNLQFGFGHAYEPHSETGELTNNCMEWKPETLYEYLATKLSATNLTMWENRRVVIASVLYHVVVQYSAVLDTVLSEVEATAGGLLVEGVFVDHARHVQLRPGCAVCVLLFYKNIMLC